MMKDHEKINIDINIGGEPLRLTVPFGKQDFTRDVELEVNNLFTTWRRRFPNKTEKGLLAMMLYQYASYYKELTEKYQEGVLKAEECLTRLADGNGNDSAE